jgi:arsenate reductase
LHGAPIRYIPLINDMSGITIWHNPRCSKSRQTLQLIVDHGMRPKVVEYLKTPPSTEELSEALDKLGIEPRALIRKKEAAYEELGLSDEGLSREELLAAMTAHPVLIERPLVFRGKRAVLGRPPENVLSLLG